MTTPSTAYMREWKRKNPDRLKAYREKGMEGERERTRRHYWRNREQILERRRERRLKEGNKEHLRLRYGLTPEAFNAMVNAQNGCCAICGLVPSKGGWKGRLNRLHVDHDHASGKVRALLCHHCNCGIGWFDENQERLQSAIDYLRRHKPTF